MLWCTTLSDHYCENWANNSTAIGREMFCNKILNLLRKQEIYKSDKQNPFNTEQGH